MNDETLFELSEDMKSRAPWTVDRDLVAPYGKCQCGCGQDAPISSCQRKDRGILKGQPQLYIFGHSSRSQAYNSPKDALLSNTEIGNSDECWLWKGTKRGNGYGCVGYNSKLLDAHRLSYEVYIGPIPDGMLVCHKCDNRLCVNPDHLFLGSYRDNYQDSKRKDRNTRGERHANSKLSDDDVIAIREAYRVRRYGDMPLLAERFGVSISTIHRIGQGTAWTHIKND